MKQEPVSSLGSVESTFPDEVVPALGSAESTRSKKLTL